MKIGIVGIGIVGSAIYKDFINKKINVQIYDKYKKLGDINNTLDCEIIFLCLPTPYCDILKSYDKKSIYEICNFYKVNQYNGLLVLKSTVEPLVTKYIYENYKINILHSPEFISAKTAYEDIKNQSHIVIGKPPNFKIELLNKLINFNKRNYPKADISIIDCTESELMKISANSFYAVKIQYFNEIYSLCQKLNISYENVKNTIIKNKWVNKMHTEVPGTDGKLSYGGMCFPKDTNALNQFLLINKSPNLLLENTIRERNLIRK